MDIPNLPFTWVDLCTEGILLPGHAVHSFIHSSSDPSTPHLTFDPVASIVSAVNLHRDYPSSLLQALASTHPDHEVWLQSYYVEKSGIEEDMGMFWKTSLGEYRALCEKGALKAVPMMCVLTIKKDEQLMPLLAKLRIVILGNHVSSFWAIVKPTTGLKATVLHLFSSLTVSGSWLAC